MREFAAPFLMLSLWKSRSRLPPPPPSAFFEAGLISSLLAPPFDGGGGGGGGAATARQATAATARAALILYIYIYFPLGLRLLLRRNAKTMADFSLFRGFFSPSSESTSDFARAGVASEALFFFSGTKLVSDTLAPVFAGDRGR